MSKFDFIDREIDAVTGPTGGWVVGPKQLKDLLRHAAALSPERETRTREALECAEYALTHAESNQQFALAAVRDALSAAALSPERETPTTQNTKICGNCGHDWDCHADTPPYPCVGTKEPCGCESFVVNWGARLYRPVADRLGTPETPTVSPSPAGTGPSEEARMPTHEQGLLMSAADYIEARIPDAKKCCDDCGNRVTEYSNVVRRAASRPPLSESQVREIARATLDDWIQGPAIKTSQIGVEMDLTVVRVVSRFAPVSQKDGR